MVLRFLGRQVVSELKDVGEAGADGVRRLWSTGQYYGSEAYKATANQVSSVATSASEYVPGIGRGQQLSWQEIRDKYRPQLSIMNGDTRTPEQQRREEELIRNLKRDVTDVKVTLMAEKEDLEESLFSSIRSKKRIRKEAKLDILEKLSKASSLDDMFRLADGGLKKELVVKGMRSRTKKLLEDIVGRIKTCRELNRMDEEEAAAQPSPRR